MTRDRRSSDGPAGGGSVRVIAERFVLSALSAGLIGVLSPSSAWALCPNCLGQARSLTPTIELLGVFLLVPFVVFLIVLRAIRRAGRF